jgi:magnesium transporter
MAPDDAADLLQTVADEQREVLFAAMPAAEAIRLRRLVGYDEESAAGLMTTEHVALRDDMTVGEATEIIRNSQLPEEMFHLPVIDRQRHLCGIINLRTLLINRANRRISDLMEQTPKAIHATSDREEVAREFDRYDLYMLPVIDHADRLLGIITVDDVIDIIRQEQTEDVQMTVGAGKGEAVYSGIPEKFRGRFPWLVTSLVMTCFAAFVVLFFEDLISEHPILAFLMPVIAALVGNAGHQALAVTLRGIVLEEVRRERVWPLVLREGAVGLVNGVGLGVLMVVTVTVLGSFTESASWKIGVVAGSALIVSTAVGTLAGSGIPLMMRRVGVDPAQSSAIFLIMITDAVAFATFLGLTSASQPWLEG